MWNQADRQLGSRAAAAIGLIGLVYVVVGSVGFFMRPPGMPLLGLALLFAASVFAAAGLPAGFATPRGLPARSAWSGRSAP